MYPRNKFVKLVPVVYVFKEQDWKNLIFPPAKHVFFPRKSPLRSGPPYPKSAQT